jgi:hypothetical protein
VIYVCVEIAELGLSLVCICSDYVLLRVGLEVCPRVHVSHPAELFEVSPKQIQIHLNIEQPLDNWPDDPNHT